MKNTASQDLLDEIELHVRNAAQPVTQLQLREHIINSFLGPDEANVLRDEVKTLRQGQREEIPTFNRRFLKAAAHAYPIPRDAEIEEQLTERYLASLLPGKIRERCFNHDPRLVDLNAATTAASNEWGKECRRIRIQRECKDEHMPMEVDAIQSSIESTDPPLRESLAAIASGMRALRQQRTTSWPTPIGYRPKKGPCWTCGQKGHYRRECNTIPEY